MNYRLLLDTSSLMYRAFFALPRTMQDQAGVSINAVHGYLDMVARLVRDYRPDELMHVYDHDWRPAGRVAAFPGYKAGRAEDPAELPPQFDLLREVLDALGASQAEAPGWEADDAIGTICTEAAPGTCLDIVTGDRDLLQLVRDGSAETPTVRVLFTERGVSDLRVFDEAAVLEKYGVPPRRYVEFATLRGDPSDGLPGVKGIGEKRARTLIAAYPSLDALVNDAEKHPPALAASLRAAAAYLEAMRLVVPVRTDVAVRSWIGNRDLARLDVLAEQRKLGGPIRRLREAVNI
jgi:5'-3' exonuclease